MPYNWLKEVQTDKIDETLGKIYQNIKQSFELPKSYAVETKTNTSTIERRKHYAQTNRFIGKK
jgi:hypothetical protein